ncbi:MAG TPA: tetratricopeptide repeat protein [Candidatus Acidoferrales bacterium]|nr:tetratricopeptide repeat protein [Candidatus Acidoferrales bacterium]
MKRCILPAVFLSLIFVIPANAQTIESAALRQVNPAPQPGPSPQPIMTPRQVAEMRADILLARKMYPEAIKAYEELAKREPKNATLFNKIGEAYESDLNYGHAEHWFKRAIKSDKTCASAYNNFGTVEYAKRHYKNAVRWYQKTLLLRPDASVAAPAYSNMGYAYFAWKKYPEAMSAFAQAIEIDPAIMTERGTSGPVMQQRGTTDPGLFYFFVARIYAQSGDAAHAAHYLKMARDIGYAKFVSAKTDPAFAKVIKDPRVQAIFVPVPEMTSSHRK